MFNGGGVNPHEQFHQFIASTTRTTLPLSLPLTLPLNHHHHHHHHHPNFISSFDPQLSHHPHQLFQSQLLHHHHQLHQNSSTHEEEQEQQEEEKEEDRSVVDCGSLEQLKGRGGGGGGVRSVSEIMDPWEKEEVLALLRIRSNMGTNGFSDFIWEHVSRKLAELGFKRSAEKCKEKFEEMDQYNNTTATTTNYGKNNYNRSFSELEALFEDQNPKSTTTTTFTTHENMVRNEGGGGGEEGKVGSLINLEENSGNETLENPYVENQQQTMVKKQHRKKRKRHHKLELLKGLCEEIVNKIMVQQEELHRKLLEDMERKEEQRVAREEAWKRKEMDRVNKEIEIRAQEQAIACDRESTIIEFLKKLTSTQSQNQELLLKFDQDTTNNTSSQNPPSPLLASPSISPSQNPSSISKVATPKLPISSTTAITTRNPNSSTTQINPKVPNSSTLDSSAQKPSSSSTTTTTTTPFAAAQDPSSTSINDRADDIGKRWPRDEVYSLINLRCNIYSNNNGADQDKETTKVPLWERISQGMLELGYKRSAKKCKEKWENINKYFRKTKDANKKRSIDSKTCPYFHQLNSLYNQGTLTLPSTDQATVLPPDNHLMSSPENQSASPKTRGTGGSSEGAALVLLNADNHDQGEKNINNISQVSPLEFEY